MHLGVLPYISRGVASHNDTRTLAVLLIEDDVLKTPTGSRLMSMFCLLIQRKVRGRDMYIRAWSLCPL